MTHVFPDLSWPGILLAFLAYTILGGLWYTVLFKRSYLTALGRPADGAMSKDPIYFVGPMICNAVITLTTAVLMAWLGITTYSGAFPLALLVGVGYLATNTVNIGINPNIPRPLLYGAITGAMHVVAITIVCMVLVAV